MTLMGVVVGKTTRCLKKGRLSGREGVGFSTVQANERGWGYAPVLTLSAVAPLVAMRDWAQA